MNYRHYNPSLQDSTQSRTILAQNMPPSKQQPSPAVSNAAGKPQPREASSQKSTPPNPMPKNNQSRLPHRQQNPAPAPRQHRSLRVSHVNLQNAQKKQLRPPAPPQLNQATPPPAEAKNLSALLQKLIPSSVYNPKSKKLFGLFSAEDLLLVALIFLCAESEDEDNSLMILALVYIFASEYISLPDLAF